MYFELQLIDGKKYEVGGLTAVGLPFVCHEVGASPHRPPHAYTYIYGETVRALSFPIRGRMQYAPTLPIDCFHPNG